MPWGAAGLVAIGLAMVGTGRPWLLRRRRFFAARQTVTATVVAAETRRLAVRLPSASISQQVEVHIPVPAGLAADWSERLAYGPPLSQDPDFEEAFLAGWDQVEVSYLPGGSPEAMLSSQVESAMQPPLLLTIGGLMFAVLGALMFYPPALLFVLGSASALIAFAFVGSFIAAHRRGVSHAPSVFEVISMILVLLFLGGTSMLAFVGAFTG